MDHTHAPATTEATATDARGRMLGFWALIATQFQGAFSNNALKWLIAFLVLESGVSLPTRPARAF